jgi:flagellar basal body-associated protein FliL
MEMSKNLIVIIISVVVVIVLAAVGIGIYYYVSSVNYNLNNPEKNTENIKEVVEITPDQQTAQLKKDYPDIITGVITFSDTKTSYKTTIKTDSGKEYILSPAQSSEIYQNFGAKNGGRVEIQGKINSQGSLEWAMIKPI